MIDYHSTLVSALETVLPTHYEMKLDSDTTVPCISYMEINNYVSSRSDTIDYSFVQFQIKVWGHSIIELNQYAVQIDAVLRPLGWKRVSSGELYDNESTMIQKIMTFEGFGFERFELGGN